MFILIFLVSQNQIARVRDEGLAEAEDLLLGGLRGLVDAVFFVLLLGLCVGSFEAGVDLTLRRGCHQLHGFFHVTNFVLLDDVLESKLVQGPLLSNLILPFHNQRLRGHSRIAHVFRVISAMAHI